MLNKLKYVLAAMLIAVFVLPQICMAGINYGSEYVFNSAATYDKSATVLDATHTLIAYRDGGHSSYGTAVIATISGNTITYGPEYVFNSANTTVISATSLDATHVLIAYKDGGWGGYGVAIIATISNSTTINYGSEYLYNAGSTTDISATSLDATHVLIAYSDGANSNYGTGIIATISGGNTISYGSEYVFNDDYAYYLSSTSLDATHALITYVDNGNSDYGTAVIATISDGNTITYGAEYVFNSATLTLQSSAVTLDATHVLIAYQDYGNFGYGTAVIATISGNTITYGAEYVFSSSDTNYPSSTTFDATHVLIAYQDYGNSQYGTGIIATISDGNTIGYGSEYVFNMAVTSQISATALDATHALIGYSDNGNSTYGTGIIATIPPGAPTVTNSTGASSITVNSAKLNGEVTDTGGENPTVHVYWGGTDGGTTPGSWANNVPLGALPAGAFNTDISGLDPNTTYYYRCYATNSGGYDWADATASLTTGSVVTVTGTSIAPLGVAPGATGVGMLKLGLVVTDAGEASWTDVKVDLTGTAVDGDISSVEVWKDDGDGTWEGLGYDTLIGSGTFISNTVTIDITDQTINTSSQDFFIVYDIAGAADPSHTAGAKLLNETYITVSGSDVVSSTGFPIESSLTTLPVTLSAFTAQFVNYIATLYWSTASENDNLGWYVYRNSNDDNFIEAVRINTEFIPGYGTTTEPHDYLYRDDTIEPSPGDVYWYWIQSIDLGGVMHLFGPTKLSIPGIPDPDPPELPVQYGLHQNWPNPFGISESSTKISFTLPITGFAEVKIYNIRGGLVRNLYTGMANGDVEVELFWNGRDENGVEQPTGIYLYQLSTNGKVNEIKRLIVIR